MKCIKFILGLIYLKLAESKVTDKEYALMPPLFHLDNYDRCMLLEDEALYCYFQYEIAPIDPENAPKAWHIIQEINSDPYNYKHDKLRHGICVPTTCQNVTTTKMNPFDSSIRDMVNDCYDARYASEGFKGNITEITCSTAEPLFPITVTDMVVAVVFFLYLAFVIFASFYEGIPRYNKPQEEYEKIMSTKFGGIMATFSVCRNWNRLTTVTETPDVIALKSIQGIRFYSFCLVVILHAMMAMLLGPISNIRYAEKLKDIPLTIIFNRDAYAMQTYFQISAWLVTYGFFKDLYGKRTLKVKDLIGAFIYRYLRLTPLLALTIIFHCTWMRHFAKGPTWILMYDLAVDSCYKNWWTNLLYLNNYIDPGHMCLPHTWTLGLDTQFFILLLLILYVAMKNVKLLWPILGSLSLLSMCITFAVSYIMDLPEAVYPYGEHIYRFGASKSDVYIYSFIPAWSNCAGPITGVALGYLFYKYRNEEIFTKKIHHVLYAVISIFLPGIAVLVPSALIYNDDYVHNRLFAATIMTFGRWLFAIGIGCCIFGFTKGAGGIARWICEWSPTYVLGRLGYSSYIIHLTILSIKLSYTWYPLYVDPIISMYDNAANVILSLIAGLFLTLLVELPMSEMLRIKKADKSTKKVDENGSSASMTKEKST